jgi:hypothetical protein
MMMCINMQTVNLKYLIYIFGCVQTTKCDNFEGFDLDVRFYHFCAPIFVCG